MSCPSGGVGKYDNQNMESDIQTAIQPCPLPVTFSLKPHKYASYFNLCFHVPKMEELKVHFQHIMLCEFKNSKNATETAKKIGSVYE